MKPSTKQLIHVFSLRGPALFKIHGNEGMRVYHANAVREERRRIGSAEIRRHLLRNA